MKSKRTQARLMGFAGLACLGFVTVHEAFAAEENPYSVIVDRNIFHLNPRPDPPPPEPVKPPDLPKVMLTGFMGKGNSEKVLFAIPGKDGKGSPTYLSLAIGEKGGDSDGHSVELLKIRLDKEEVDIVNSGTTQTLNVKSNGYIASASPAAPGHGGPPGPGGLPGMHKGPPEFSLPTPPQAMPHAGNTIQPSSGGSSIIAGGGGNSSSGVITGGGGGYGNEVGGAAANAFNAANNANGRNGASNPNAVPVPVEVQAASMLIHEAAGGPPSPIREDGSSAGGPPMPTPR